MVESSEGKEGEALIGAALVSGLMLQRLCKGLNRSKRIFKDKNFLFLERRIPTLSARIDCKRLLEVLEHADIISVMPLDVLPSARRLAGSYKPPPI